MSVAEELDAPMAPQAAAHAHEHDDSSMHPQPRSLQPTHSVLSELLAFDRSHICHSSSVREEARVAGLAAALSLLEITLRHLQAGELAAALAVVPQCERMLWDTLHTQKWRQVPDICRFLYGSACRAWAVALIQAARPKQALFMLDMGIMLGGPAEAAATFALVQVAESAAASGTAATTAHVPPTEEDAPPQLPCSATRLLQTPPTGSHTKRKRTEDDTHTGGRSRGIPVPVLHCPSIIDFLKHAMVAQQPVIITGAMEHWPALGVHDASRAWSNLQYLKSVAGLRTVPVEIGEHYMSAEWTQQLMPLSAFIERYIESPEHKDASGEGLGYLAQHPLFDQIPSLRADISIPDYCSVGMPPPKAALDSAEAIVPVEQEPQMNAWFGPCGTVTPLHFDPAHNLLCQVVGSKRIRLYHPRHSPNLAPHDGIMSNTSKIDVENPAPEHAALMAQVPFWECELMAGSMLYIPPKFWHHVRSLSLSFSVSFWWQ